MSDPKEAPLLTAEDADEILRCCVDGIGLPPRLRNPLCSIASGSVVCIEARELEAIRKDAARYRWLRDNGPTMLARKEWSDSSIDDALAADGSAEKGE